MCTFEREKIVLISVIELVLPNWVLSVIFPSPALRPELNTALTIPLVCVCVDTVRENICAKQKFNERTKFPFWQSLLLLLYRLQINYRRNGIIRQNKNLSIGAG